MGQDQDRNREQEHGMEGRPTESGEIDAAALAPEDAPAFPPRVKGNDTTGGFSIGDLEASGTDGAGTGGVGDDAGGYGPVDPDEEI